MIDWKTESTNQLKLGVGEGEELVGVSSKSTNWQRKKNKEQSEPTDFYSTTVDVGLNIY